MSARKLGLRMASMSIALAASFALPSCSTSSSSGAGADSGADDSAARDAGPCIPALGSCDVQAIEMSPLDTTRGCMASLAVVDVCVTSVNRCTPSAGLAAMCAFSPDGKVYAAISTDNYMLTGAGWHFVLPLGSYPNPNAIPPEQIATAEQAAQCQAALCTAPCPGAQRINYWGCGDAGADGGGMGE